MKFQPRVKRQRLPVADAPAVHPADGPRSAGGSKSDAWVIGLPALQPAPGQAIVAFSTGRDSATIMLGGVEGTAPRRHPGHDLAVVLAEGSGVLRHGPAPDALTDARYTAPCTLLVAAGAWHAIVPDAGAPAGVAFFTRPGATIDPFSVVGPRAEPGLVHLDTLPVSPWPMTPAQVVNVPAGARVTSRLRVATDAEQPVRPARVVPYDPPAGDHYSLPVDTGTDSLFVMTSTNRSWDRAPVDVPVHRHDREDEYIVIDAGAVGWLLNGPAQESVQRTRFSGPCVLVMPSGNFHRVVRNDDALVRSVLIYAHRSQVAGSWQAIVDEMELREDAA